MPEQISYNGPGCPVPPYISTRVTTPWILSAGSL